MALAIPELIPPLQSVSACASGISFTEHTEIEKHIPTDKTELLAKLESGSYLQLIREQLESGKCHFHLDLFAKDYVESAHTNSTFEEISKLFDAVLLGKTLPINFHSRFRLIQQVVTPFGMIPSPPLVGVNFGGISGALSSATIRLSDSVYRELKWQQSAPKQGAPARLDVELRGTLGLISVSPNIFEIVVDRANAGFQRMINPARHTPKPQGATTPK
jgi:hypothetical protein